MSLDMEHGHPMEVSFRGFVASHLLQCSTNRLNGKQPVTHFDSDALLTFLGWPTLFFFLNP